MKSFDEKIESDYERIIIFSFFFTALSFLSLLYITVSAAYAFCSCFSLSLSLLINLSLSLCLCVNLSCINCAEEDGERCNSSQRGRHYRFVHASLFFFFTQRELLVCISTSPSIFQFSFLFERFDLRWLCCAFGWVGEDQFWNENSHFSFICFLSSSSLTLFCQFLHVKENITKKTSRSFESEVCVLMCFWGVWFCVQAMWSPLACSSHHRKLSLSMFPLFFFFFFFLFYL